MLFDHCAHHPSCNNSSSSRSSKMSSTSHRTEATTAATTATPSGSTSVNVHRAQKEDEASHHHDGITERNAPGGQTEELQLHQEEQRHHDDGDDDVAAPPPPPATMVVTIPSPLSSSSSLRRRGSSTAPLPPPPPAPTNDCCEDRAVHTVQLSALERNYRHVEGAANRQRCSVIAVVKADGYGHGAIATALHLADSCGADAFAVATLEEGIALRKAFQENPPGRWKMMMGTGNNNNKNNKATAMAPPSRATNSSVVLRQQFNDGSNNSSSSASDSSLSSPINNSILQQSNNNNSVMTTTQQHVAAARCRRPAQIRILVLGPPVGYPKCFNDYYFYGIEVMISGPEVATALAAWVANDTERRRTAVERAAMETKEQALSAQQHPQLVVQPPPPSQLSNNNNAIANNNTAAEEKKEEASSSSPNKTSSAKSNESSPTAEARKRPLPHPASTLGNVQGQDLAKEVRAMLLNQKAATDKAAAAAEAASTVASQRSSPTPSDDGMKKFVTAACATTTNSNAKLSTATSQTPAAAAPAAAAAPKQVFGGIEAVAKHSRARAMANNNNSNTARQTTASTTAHPPVINRKRLRWHALVDSGMGRLGFKTDPVDDPETEGRRDTVEILQELVHAEIFENAPIEFYGMCTHMADATATSTYTHSQMDKFGALLERVRSAGISVPTVSTDNSAALLTASLNHFDPDALLAQPHTNTRGYVRCGGAIFGQRPSFRELQPLSTLTASVRHVAVLRRGESVGYDRAYVAAYNVRIATLAIGFADGYPRELGNGVGRVSIRGSLFPVAGNVCMDMLMVELGPADEWDGAGATVVVGDTAVLWGNEDIRLQDVAATLKTTQSALTCGLNTTRVARLYV